MNTDTLHNQQQELLARKARAIAQLQELQAGERPETIAAAKAVISNFQGQLNLENQKRIGRASLYAEGAISREQLDEAEASVASLHARFEAQSDLDRLRSGRVSERIEAQKASIRELDANLANIKIELNKAFLKTLLREQFPSINAIVVVDEVNKELNLDRGIRPHKAISKTIRYLTVPLLASTPK